ncbi:hypothetical protein VTN00DRAFT_2969 [Thermoascus crustaceus]|uniref:uncharacterized protein n=1 Tax=Thermoascus crustaceus TaxID=5088 RepID=UPI00374364C4
MSAVDSIRESSTTKVPAGRDVEIGKSADGAVDGPSIRCDEGVGEDGRVVLTEEDNKRILRKTDKVILPILVWVYFLQILDKSVLGYASIFGLAKDTNLRGNQYSMVGSIAPIAQLAWQPFSSFLIVRVPHRILMPVLVLGWGIAQTAMAACSNYAGLLVCRFFLGLFEGGCLPLFSIITTHWYRRAEQPIRVAAWYGTNGLATVIGSALSYGLGQIQSERMKSWQIIFLFVGLLTILTVPFIYWKLDNSVTTARFLTPSERHQAIERLRANQTGLGTEASFKWNHLIEALLDPKTYLWLSMSLLLNVGAAVTNVFGPLILDGLGFNKSITSLLNMPFGAVQVLVILLASYAAQKVRLKSPVFIALIGPVITGVVMLYALPHGSTSTTNNTRNQPALLAAYYLLATLFGSNPIIVSWIMGNTAGATKKSVIMAIYNAGSSAGNIIGPLLFNSDDAPAYRPGLRAVLGINVALVVVIALQVGNLVLLNRGQERRRVRAGKGRVVHDSSMDNKFVSSNERREEHTGKGKDGTMTTTPGAEDAVKLDLTDRENDEFVYIY